MGNDIRSSTNAKALAARLALPTLGEAMDEVRLSVDRFCLLAGIEALQEMMADDATAVCGARHRRHGGRRGWRWGTARSEIGYHGGKVKVVRPRVRDRAGNEVGLARWEALRDGEMLREWAMNLMVLNVSTRKYRRAVRLPEGDLPGACGDGTSKSAVSRRFVALSRNKMKAWFASDLSDLDLLVIQIDGLHVGDHVLVAAIGVDSNGDKHVLAVVEGATENTATVQALLDNLVGRGLDPTALRLFIVDGAKALTKAIRNTFGVAVPLQRCQVHKGRNMSSVSMSPCTPASRRRCARPGTRTTRTRPSGCSRTWPGAWSIGNRASRPASWRASTRSSPSSVSACRTNSGARSPVPTSSRTRWERSARSAATSSAGAMPRWPSAGLPPA